MKLLATILLSVLFNLSYAQSDKKLADSITKKYNDVYPSNKDGYYYVRNKKNKTGMIDSIGNVIIKPSFEYIERFENNRAEAGNLFKGKMKRGLIDFNGNIVVPFMYDYIYTSENENWVVEIGEQYGMINKNNKIIIPIKYQYVTEANENIIIVKENNKYGFIGEDGKAITKNIYKEVERFYEKKAAVVLEDNSGTIINVEGKEMFKPLKNIQFKDIKKGLFKVYNIVTKKSGVYNENGREIIPLIYDEIELGDDYIKVKKNNKYGTLDRENNIKIPLEYNEIYYRNNNQFICTKQKLYAVINNKNETIIPLNYNHIEMVDEKYFFARALDSTTGVMDLNGKEILPVEYKIYGNCNGKIFASKKDIFYIINLEDIENKIEINIDQFKTKHASWYFYNDCSLVAIKNNKYGIVDIDNNIVIPFEYDDVQKLYFKSNYIVKMNGKYGIINKENKIIRPIIYDRIIQHKEETIFYKEGKRVIPTLQ
jgi:WG containing repeat